MCCRRKRPIAQNNQLKMLTSLNSSEIDSAVSVQHLSQQVTIDDVGRNIERYWCGWQGVSNTAGREAETQKTHRQDHSPIQTTTGYRRRPIINCKGESCAAATGSTKALLGQAEVRAGRTTSDRDTDTIKFSTHTTGGSGTTTFPKGGALARGSDGNKSGTRRIRRSLQLSHHRVKRIATTLMPPLGAGSGLSLPCFFLVSDVYRFFFTFSQDIASQSFNGRPLLWTEMIPSTMATEFAGRDNQGNSAASHSITLAPFRRGQQVLEARGGSAGAELQIKNYRTLESEFKRGQLSEGSKNRSQRAF